MPRLKKTIPTGTIFPTKHCGYVTVIEYVDYSNIKVRFENTGHERKVRSHALRAGSIRDPYARLVFGVGFLGEGKFKASNKSPFYQRWVDMLKRCYSEKHRGKNKSYRDCVVCDDWHCFQNFAEWMNNQDWEGKQLDKDIKGGGLKIYSPENCMFVDQKENICFSLSGSYDFVSPSGECIHVVNLSEFCRKNRLDRGYMIDLSKGRIKKYKGWTCKV